MAMKIEELVERKVGINFPAIQIITPNDTVPLIVTTLEKGDMQVILEYNGKRKVICSISQSALSVNQLLRTVGSLKYLKSENETIIISSIEDYLLAL